MYCLANIILQENLPASFPRAVGQEPLYYNQKSTGRPNGGSTVTYTHYTDVKRTALFPFGFGLSYTTFKYGDLQLSSDKMDKSGKIEASIDITNTGKVKGKETVQLYLRDLIASTTRPVKELKGFKQVELNPGETKTVTFAIDEKMLEFYSINKKWESEPGEFKVMVGGNSEDLKEASFELTE